MDLQAQDRCHRIGQMKPVIVYRFVTANTIDQKIVERASTKRKLEKMIIHKGLDVICCSYIKLERLHCICNEPLVMGTNTY